MTANGPTTFHFDRRNFHRPAGAGPMAGTTQAPHLPAGGGAGRCNGGNGTPDGNGATGGSGGGGATSTGKFVRGGTIGAGIGYLGGLATGVPGAANTGAMIGGVIGGLATSPASIKQLLKVQGGLKSLVKNKKTMQLEEIVKKLNEKYAPEELKAAQQYLTPQAIPQSAWQLMRGEE